MLVNGVLRYTFAGEFFERFVHEVTDDLPPSEASSMTGDAHSQEETIRIAG